MQGQPAARVAVSQPGSINAKGQGQSLGPIVPPQVPAAMAPPQVMQERHQQPNRVYPFVAPLMSMQEMAPVVRPPAPALMQHVGQQEQRPSMLNPNQLVAQPIERPLLKNRSQQPIQQSLFSTQIVDKECVMQNCQQPLQQVQIPVIANHQQLRYLPLQAPGPPYPVQFLPSPTKQEMPLAAVPGSTYGWPMNWPPPYGNPVMQTSPFHHFFACPGPAWQSQPLNPPAMPPRPPPPPEPPPPLHLPMTASGAQALGQAPRRQDVQDSSPPQEQDMNMNVAREYGDPLEVIPYGWEDEKMDPDGGMTCSTPESKRTREPVRDPGTGESADRSQKIIQAFVHQQQSIQSAANNAKFPPPASVTNAIAGPTIGHAHSLIAPAWHQGGPGQGGGRPATSGVQAGITGAGGNKTVTSLDASWGGVGLRSQLSSERLGVLDPQSTMVQAAEHMKQMGPGAAQHPAVSELPPGKGYQHAVKEEKQHRPIAAGAPVLPMQWLPSPLQVRPLIPAVSLPQQRPVAQPKQSHVAQNQIQLQVRQPAFRIPTAQRRPIAQLPMHVVQDLVNTTQQQKQYPALLSAIPFHPILLRFNLSNAGFHLLSAQEHLLFVPPQTHIPQLPLQNVPNQILIGMLFSKPFAADSSSESGTSAAVGPKHPVDLVAIPTTRNLFLSVRALTARDFGIGQSRTSTAIGMPTFAQLQTAALHCGTCHTGLQCGAMQTATWQNGALQTAALRIGARQTGFQCGTMQIANMPTRLRGSDPNSAMGMSALREITPPVWQQPGIGKGTEMPLFVGRQGVLSQRAVNLPVTSVAAEFGGLALQGQAGTGLPVSLAASLRTHGQRELMAQVNGPYLEESAICPVRFLKEEAKSSGARVPSSKTCATELPSDCSAAGCKLPDWSGEHCKLPYSSPAHGKLPRWRRGECKPPQCNAAHCKPAHCRASQSNLSHCRAIHSKRPHSSATNSKLQNCSAEQCIVPHCRAGQCQQLRRSSEPRNTSSSDVED